MNDVIVQDVSSYTRETKRLFYPNGVCCRVELVNGKVVDYHFQKDKSIRGEIMISTYHFNLITSEDVTNLSSVELSELININRKFDTLEDLVNFTDFNHLYCVYPALLFDVNLNSLSRFIDISHHKMFDIMEKYKAEEYVKMLESSNIIECKNLKIIYSVHSYTIEGQIRVIDPDGKLKTSFDNMINNQSTDISSLLSIIEYHSKC
jgi:hypothetical protein